MTEVVYTPDRRHHCGPSEHGYWSEMWNAPAGTVRGCECGKTWVAFRDRTDPGYMGVKWRREGWLARRRRIKRSSRV